MSAIDLSPEPDLHPLYPTPAHVSALLEPSSGLSPPQRSELVSHALSRATAFGDLSLLTFLLGDRSASQLVDLQSTDEDGLSALSATITGFGAESERDVEREECVRLLVAEGADVGAEDGCGWTALHHAALRAPPTVVAFLLTHGASLFATTRRGLTPLDIVAAHTTVPGREDVALLLAEAMRSQGWQGGRMDARRKAVEARMAKRARRRRVQDDVGRALAISPRWWGDAEVWDDDESSDGSDDEGEDPDERVYTPPPDYGTMLVFAPPSLPYIFHSLITDFAPALRNAEPANALYMLARFACLACDNTWLEDLIIGATDAIEDAFFNRSEDLECLVFWLYNTTAWLHLMRCDNAISETCEVLGSFVLIEEVINSVFVFIIRYVERRIDGLLDSALLDHAALPTEFDNVQFEDEWSLFRSFKKKSATPSQPHTPTRPTTPPPQPVSPRNNFASLRNTFSRTRAGSAAPTTPLQSLFAAEQSQQQNQPSPPAGPRPADITDFFDALQTLLTLSGINPALITQMWSQVIYWIACELFNRILSRKKYLCRSRAVQIGMNLGALEEWAARANLPRGVVQHLAPVRDLLNWLQCLSSISEFTALITTVQTMRHLNPLQMRRAVRDYRYEVNEGRMDDECAQYLAQLQKDWERHRVKMGVEALRKEMSEREREDSDSVSLLGDSGSAPKLASSASSLSISTTDLTPHNSIDLLFAHDSAAADGWTPTRPPEILGELLDSRHMLPLLLPSDPRLLAAAPKRPAIWTAKGSDRQHEADSRASSRASRRAAGVIPWRSAPKAVRDVGADVLTYVDGGRWARYGPTYGYAEADGEMEMEGDESFDEAHALGHDADITLTAEDGGLVPEYVAGLTAKPHRARSAAASPAVGAVDLPS